MEIGGRAAYYVLHYGAEWLKWSLRSIEPHVDRIFIFYTDRPSFGHQTTISKPAGESRDELKAIADRFGCVVWKDADRPYDWEGQHRDQAVNYVKSQGYKTIITVDADEIWSPDVFRLAMDSLASNSDHIWYRIGMIHFWRSVDWVCNDPAMPTRIMVPNASNDKGEGYLPGKVFHMGYAQTPDLIRYKESIHGHKAEWRKGWFENKFMAWQPGMRDVHPTCENDFWVPEPYVDDGTLEFLIGDHPYWKKEIIV